MSNEISATTESRPANDLDKLTSLFNEEIYVRTDANSIPASKFKIFDDLIEFYKSAGKIDEAKRKSKNISPNTKTVFQQDIYLEFFLWKEEKLAILVF